MPATIPRERQRAFNLSEVAGLTGEQNAWLVVSLEIEQLLNAGFKGDIILHCSGDGTVKSYHASEFRKPGERRVQERRTAGPRDGEDRRKG